MKAIKYVVHVNKQNVKFIMERLRTHVTNVEVSYLIEYVKEFKKNDIDIGIIIKLMQHTSLFNLITFKLYTDNIIDKKLLDIRFINTSKINITSFIFIRQLKGYEEDHICDICCEKNRRSYYKCKCVTMLILCVICYSKLKLCPYCRDNIT